MVELVADDGAVIEIPSDASDPVVIEDSGGQQLEVTLPGDAEDASVTEDGSVIFEDAVEDTDIVVQAQEDGGVRMIAVIDGPQAPYSFDFPTAVPGAETLQVLSDGSAAVMNGSGEVISEVPAPWAYDAEGNAVPAWYSVSGDTLVLHVDHSAVEAYPVVADPCWSCAWNKVKRTVSNNWPGWLAGFSAGMLVRITCWGATGAITVTTGGAAVVAAPSAIAACHALGIGASYAVGRVVNG